MFDINALNELPARAQSELVRLKKDVDHLQSLYKREVEYSTRLSTENRELRTQLNAFVAQLHTFKMKAYFPSEEIH